MTSVPSAPPSLAQTAAAALPVLVRVTATPSTLSRLPVNGQLEGQVLQAAHRGQPTVLQTDVGALTLRTSQALPQGAQVTLDVLSQTRGGALMRIAAVNGQALGQTSAVGVPNSPVGSGAQNTASALADGPQTATPRSAASDGLLTATVVRRGASAVSPGPSGAATGAFKPGTILRATLMGISTPTAPSASGLATPGASPFGPSGGPAIGPSGGLGTGWGQASGRTVPGHVPPMGTDPSARPGEQTIARQNAGVAAANDIAAQARAGMNTMFGRIGSALSMTAAPPSPSAVTATPGLTGPAGAGGSPAGGPSGQATVQATLVGTVQSGGGSSRTLLATPGGTLALHLRLDAPPGSQVTLGIVSATPPPTGAGAGAMAGALGPQSLPQGGTQGWPALTEALETLAQRDTAAARVLQQMIPQPGPQLAANLVTLASALRAGGDSRQWPGSPSLRALEDSGPKGQQLASALRGDLQALAARPREKAGRDWRVLSLPVWDGADISAITILTRVHGGRIQDDDEANAAPRAPPDSGDRFVIDITLSHLGRIQIDGLLRPKAHQLHLILRTAGALPDAMHQDLTVIAETGLAALGLDGSLTFQPDGRFVEPESVPATATHQVPPPDGVIA